jgi:PKD repeat protein
VTFQATASSPVGSQESGDFTYTFTWGDGQKTIVSGGTSVSTTHTYDSGGSYTASLVVLDSLSTSSATVTTSVTISNVAPIITSFTHPNGSTGVATQFSVLVSDASNADTAAGFSIVWNFGDGSQPVTGANLNNTSHQFSTPGTYTVSVTATDQNGLQATASATIIIRDTPPSVSLGPTQSVAKNTPVTLTPTLNPDNPLWSYTYAWTLGDGTSASGPTVTESFASLGTYTVSVLVTDPFGGSGTGSVTINVVNQPPVVTNVLVSPANPLAQQQPLTLSYTYADPNGSPENGTTIVWYLNGEGDAAYNNKTTIPATALQRNQTWYAVVTPKDGIAFGAPVTSNTVTVGDPPPQALNVTLSPTNPKHADTLSLSYTYSSVYPEQGTTISWTRNGSVQPTLANQKSVPPPLTRGDTWMVTVTPSDGMTMGAPETTSVVIQDTAPVLAALPDLTRMATGLTTSVSWTVSATDIDGDTVAYDCATPQQDLGHGPAYSFAFPLGATTVTCTASDGTLTTTDTFQVHINDVLPTLALTPSETVDPGNVTLVATASDPFGRPLTYAWTVVSGPQGLTPRGSTNAAIFSFSAFTAGSYVLQCAVSNGTDQTLAQTTVTVAQLAPQVNLGASPRTLVVGETITLDGSHSVDPNGGTLTWKWAVASGPVTIAGSNSAITSLTASAGGQGVVSLTVDDGARSSTAQLVVNVWDNGSATAPVASAGPAQTVVPGSKVTLDASSSFDPNAQVLTWSWAQQSGPNVTLSDVTAENPTFVAPPSGTLSFVLTATDSAGASQSTVHVNVMGSDTEKIPTAVINPVDVTIAVGGTATLQNESLSPLALSLTPTWTWVGGPYVTLTPDAQARTCAVTAYGTGEAVIQLVVNDGVFDSAPALARVHVTEGVMAAPSATVPASLAGAAGTPIVLDGSSSADPNGLPLVAQWTQLSGPPVAIHGSETLKASFDPSAPGTYTFQLGLSDWIFDASATLTVNVSMEDVPVAVATGPATAYVGDSVALSGAQSHDPQGGALTFTWTQVSGPPATLDKAGTASPSFQPTTNGTYVFQLEVANGATTSAPATITIKVEHFPRLRGGCSEAAETGWLAALVLLGWIRRRTSR